MENTLQFSQANVLHSGMQLLTIMTFWFPLQRDGPFEHTVCSIVWLLNIWFDTSLVTYSKCYVLTECRSWWEVSNPPTKICHNFDWFINWLSGLNCPTLIKYWSDECQWMYIIHSFCQFPHSILLLFSNIKLFFIFAECCSGVDIRGYKQRLIDLDSFKLTHKYAYLFCIHVLYLIKSVKTVTLWGLVVHLRTKSWSPQTN